MRSYTPDKWMIIDYSPQYLEDERYAVMAGWGGGFTTGASWKRSSPIISAEEVNGEWNICTLSGAVYVLSKTGYGTTGHTACLLMEAQLTTLSEEEMEELFKKFNEGK